jgi:ATP-dependent helicase/nuclease subunit B
MSAAKKPVGIYNIPAGIAFARSLAAQLISETSGTPETLPAYRIILPTRRAARVLREAFRTENPGKPMLLPQMHALGDIDEEELSVAFAGDEPPPEWLDIKPALPPLKRQVLLAQTVMRLPGYAKNFDQALLLAKALGGLMDHVYTEGLDLKKLPELVSEERLSTHWQVTLKFMEILSERWPEVLAENGVIDAADRRNKLLRVLAKNWRKSPPSGHIIAAGTTGSIPATAELLQVIAALPKGRVVLPGLDTGMDEPSWKALDETHPQYGLKHLLEILETPREAVAPWPRCGEADGQERRWLAAEIMRPAETTPSWTRELPGNATAKKTLKAALENLKILTCDNEREEAMVIAVMLRQALETPGQTAALITPRRSLARRVAAACRRWGIVLDDSAGQPLSQTPAGSFMLLSAQAAASDFSPVALLALLKHPACQATDIEKLDLALRGPKPKPGLGGIAERDKAGIMGPIEPVLARFMTGSLSGKPRKFSKTLTAHIEMAETLAGGPENFWLNEDGQQASAFFAELSLHADLFPDLSLPEYAAVLASLMDDKTVRPPFGTHPRLQILGQLEARMTDADLVIMAGLNEKSWPPAPGFDPWMSRPMRKEFGLPSAERSIGLAAHDFVQGFCAKNVVITRSSRQDGGPATPARWLQRLEAVLQAAGISLPKENETLQWATALDEAAAFSPAKRPEPRPPIAARPRKLSVTRIEKWRQDPYGIYAEYVLRLRKLNALEKPPEAAEKGILLHAVMKRFTDKAPQNMPADAAQILTDIAADEISKRNDDPAAWSFWKRRFDKAAIWLVQHETDWRQIAQPRGTEITGEISFSAPAGDFSLKATADRIDTVPGGAAVIDYKSGGTFSPTDVRNSKKPQLPLEGLILAKGGFEPLGTLKPVSLQYWKLTGALKLTDEPIALNEGVDAVIADAEQGLKNLIAVFDNDKTPYYSVPAPEFAPRFNDYKHLARIAEWAALDDEEAA